MRKSWLMCVLLGTLAWGQAAPSAPSKGIVGNVRPGEPTPQAAQAPVDNSASVPDDAAVITIIGVCPEQTAVASAAAAGAPAADCKTVITKAQFEAMLTALAGKVTPQGKRQLANNLPKSIGVSSEAKKQGLDKTPQFDLALSYWKMQVLAKQLMDKIAADAANVPQANIEKYYQEHLDDYSQFNLDRLFVPRTKQGEAAAKMDNDKDEKLSDDAKKAKETEEKMKQDEAEQAMTKLAESLRTRAAAGEDIVKLQKEAFAEAGMKIETPSVNLPSVRRTGLPQGQSAVFDLKAGEVSQVITDAGGHYIYKVNSKTQLTLEQVTTEIHNKLQTERNREMNEALNNSFKVETNETYFPGGLSPAAGAPPRVQRPRPMPPTGPGAQPQAPSPAQPPAAKPN